MIARRISIQALTAMAMAAFATVVLAGSALALEATGADNYEVGGTYNVLQVDGEQGDTIFLTVKQGDRIIARDYACTLDAANANADGTAYFVTMDSSDLGSKLDGSFSIEAYSSRSEDGLLYTGSLYGVYADFPDASSQLIGVRTIGSADASRSFNAPESLYVDGRTFKLAGGAEGSGVLHFAYEEYDESTTVDGLIKYVDMAGAVVATTKIPGIPFGGESEADIPSAITADNGDIYRTVSSFDRVVAQNPGQTAFTIQCVKMSDADKAAANYYVATIQLVDGEGNVIATDSVNVTGEFLYTAPATIYKSVADGSGESQVVEYGISGSPLIHLSAANDGVTDHARTISVRYDAADTGGNQTEVTFNLLDGSKRVNDKGRVLGSASATVDKENPTAVPEAEIEVGGTRYYLAGDPSDYAYSFASGKMPAVDVYYTPEGYSAPGAYEVTVNYVNFLTGATVGSQTVQSSPDDLGAISIDTPESFSADGVDYVRLAGQDAAIEHSYYSGIAAYTVYYRDVNDTLTSGTVINTIRVVYADGETGTVGAGGTNAAGADDVATATATTRAAAEAADARDLQLNAGRTYNVLDGDGNNSTLTNEEGVDSNTERIEDDENPLASGVEGDGQGSVVQGVPAWALPVGVVVAALAVLLFAMWAVRRRQADDNGENA